MGCAPGRRPVRGLGSFSRARYIQFDFPTYPFLCDPEWTDRMAHAGFDDMTWGIDELLADITRHIVLHPGDVVFTGTPWHS